MLEKYNYSEMPFNSFKEMWLPGIWISSNFLLFPKCSYHMDYSYYQLDFLKIFMLENYNYSEMPFNSFKGMWLPEIWTPSNFLLFPKCSCNMDYNP